MTDWLVDTLVATSALILLVLIVREPVRRQFGATAAYSLWLIPAARMAMPPITQTVERIVPAAEPVVVTPLALAQFAPAVSDPSLIERLGGWPTLLLSLWATGAILFLALGFLRYHRQRRVALEEAVQLAKLGNIRLVRSHAVRGPIAFGIFDRVIAVPHDFDQRFDESQRRLALDHELSHHRSGDLIVNHLAFVLLGLLWFNPLAWLAHAAFRFDQEAACDARILDHAGPGDRAAYGQTIAKAASGRALLFASALDHQNNLHRRLKSMLTNPTPSRRLAGKAVIVGALAIALPLTATWATRYVDVVAPAAPEAPTPPKSPAPAAAPEAPLAPLAPLPAAAPLAPVPPQPPTTHRHHNGDADIGFVGGESVWISGKTKRWTDLSPSERAQIRRETARARQELDRETARLPEQMAQARREVEKFRNGEFQREMANARVEIRQALAEIDGNSAAIRAAGKDPEALKAQVRASLREVENMDIDKLVRESLASIDPDKIAAQLAEAKASLARIESRLDQLERN